MTVTVSNLNFPWPVGHTTIGGPENSQVQSTTEILSAGGIVFCPTATLQLIGATVPVVGDGVSTSFTAGNFTNVANHRWTWSNGQLSGLAANTEYTIRAWAHSSQVGNVRYYYGPTAHVTTTPYAHVAPTVNLNGGVVGVVMQPGSGNAFIEATCNGRVTDNGSGGDPSTQITQRGYVLAINPNPTVSAYNVEWIQPAGYVGVSALPAHQFTNLFAGIPWYYRAFATNNAGLTGYSAVQGPFFGLVVPGSQAGEVDAGFPGGFLYTPPPPPLLSFAVIDVDLRAWLSYDRGAVLGNRALHRATSQRDHEPRQRQPDEQLAIVNALVRDTGGDGIVVAPPPPPPGKPAFWHASPNDGKVGTPYSYTWAAIGPPLPTLVMTGDIPPGLTFTPGTQGNGTLEGTPTSSDTIDHTHTVTVTATNANGSTSVTNDIVIKAKAVTPPPGHSLLGWNGFPNHGSPVVEGGLTYMEGQLGFAFKGGWSFIGTAHPTTLADVLTFWDGDTTHDLLWPLGMCPNGISLAQGAAGAADQHWKDTAQLFLDHARPNAIARFGWEFNQPNHFAWAFDKPGASAVNYVKYYRRICSLMRAIAPNLRTIYNPGMGNWGITGTGADWYPGDDVITYVGLDFYDQIFPSYPLSVAKAWSMYGSGDVTGRTAGWGLNWLASFATTHDKPIIIPEVGPGFSANAGQNGGDNGFSYLMSQLHDWCVTHHAYMAIAAVGSTATQLIFPTKFPKSFATLKAEWP